MCEYLCIFVLILYISRVLHFLAAYDKIITPDIVTSQTTFVLYLELPVHQESHQLFYKHCYRSFLPYQFYLT